MVPVTLTSYRTLLLLSRETQLGENVADRRAIPVLVMHVLRVFITSFPRSEVSIYVRRDEKI